MNFQTRVIIIVAKLIQTATRLLGTGGGSALPGLFIQKIQPNILTSLRHYVKGKIICISGTNGKTSTANHIATTLKLSGQQILHNKNGSNLERGVISAFVGNATWWGSLSKIDTAIFECDEAALTAIVPKLKPTHLVLTNLFRDQLDRYGEIESTRKKWEHLIKNITWPLVLIYNAADPQLHALSISAKSATISSEPVLLTHLHPQKGHHTVLNPLINVHCPYCNTILQFEDEIIIGQGTFSCPNCNFTNREIKAIILPSITYKAINNILAKSVLHSLKIDPLQKEIPTEVFGRGELIQVKNQQWNIILIKNPNGAYQAIKESLIQTQDSVVFALNDNFADGTDVSWIWDIPLEELLPAEKSYFAIGTRIYDIALRLKYLDLHSTQLDSWQQLLEIPHHNITIFATYTAMLNLQDWLTRNGYKQAYWK